VNIEILVHQFCDYSTHFKGYTKATIRRYRKSISYYCRAAQVSTIDQVTDENVRAIFINGRVQRNWKASTFITYQKSLFVFFRWCKEHGYLKTNPAADIEVPKLEHRLPSFFTKQDALKLLEVVYNYPYDYPFLRYRNHAIFSTYIFAGLRKTELLNLKYTDVDLQNMSLFVRQGKGMKDRIIPICYTLAHSLSRYIEERKRLKKACPEFFASLNRNMGFSNSGLLHLVKKIRTVSGLNFTIHKLRHTFATLMAEGGCKVEVLAELMGHNNIQTTLIYTHTSAAHLRNQIAMHPLDVMQTNKTEIQNKYH
jgi:site-specific recombinase XerD